MRRLQQARIFPGIVMGVIAVLIAAASGAYAATTGGRTISVCVHHEGGGLYKAARCAKHDKKLSWNAKGQAGPRGVTGPQGLQGPAGTFDTSNFYTKAQSDSRYLAIGGTAANAGELAGMTPAQVAASQHPVLQAGVATTLAPYTCAFVFSFGVGSNTNAGEIVAMWLTDSGGNAIPALDNQTAFIPGTVALTSQGGTIAYSQVCNLKGTSDSLPAGWKIATRVV